MCVLPFRGSFAQEEVAILFIHKQSLSSSLYNKFLLFWILSVFTEGRFYVRMNTYRFETFTSITLMEQFLYAAVHFCVHFN